jgi:hypothetical protein
LFVGHRGTKKVGGEPGSFGHTRGSTIPTGLEGTRPLPGSAVARPSYRHSQQSFRFSALLLTDRWLTLVP